MTTDSTANRVSFLLDVDNTLLDNDRVIADLRKVLTGVLGPVRQERYWTIFESVRAELGYADYLGTLQRYRVENPRDASLITISSFLLNYPFADRLFPGAMEVIRHLNRLGRAIIMTDGDVVFQPRKIERSGLLRAVEDRILLYVHKERELADVEQRFPSPHYVLIDDKVRILAAVKAAWRERVTTIFPRQGHYAHDKEVERYPAPDVTVDHIADVLRLDFESFHG